MLDLWTSFASLIFKIDSVPKSHKQARFLSPFPLALRLARIRWLEFGFHLRQMDPSHPLSFPNPSPTSGFNFVAISLSPWGKQGLAHVYLFSKRANNRPTNQPPWGRCSLHKWMSAIPLMGSIYESVDKYQASFQGEEMDAQFFLLAALRQEGTRMMMRPRSESQNFFWSPTNKLRW